MDGHVQAQRLVMGQKHFLYRYNNLLIIIAIYHTVSHIHNHSGRKSTVTWYMSLTDRNIIILFIMCSLHSIAWILGVKVLLILSEMLSQASWCSSYIDALDYTISVWLHSQTTQGVFRVLVLYFLGG